YVLDTLERLTAFSRARVRGRTAAVLHADARTVAFDRRFDGIVTSPPYPGLIDYHEQHRYAYELLGLEDRRELELGPAVRGQGCDAVRAYVEGMIAVLSRAQ